MYVSTGVVHMSAHLHMVDLDGGSMSLPWDEAGLNSSAATRTARTTEAAAADDDDGLHVVAMVLEAECGCCRIGAITAGPWRGLQRGPENKGNATLNGLALYEVVREHHLLRMSLGNRWKYVWHCRRNAAKCIAPDIHYFYLWYATLVNTSRLAWVCLFVVVWWAGPPQSCPEGRRHDASSSFSQEATDCQLFVLRVCTVSFTSPEALSG